MKKIIWALCLFALCAFAQTNEIKILVQDFSSLNLELEDLNKKSDNNASIFSKEKAALKKEKAAILEKLPSVISSQGLNREFMQEFVKPEEAQPKRALMLELDELFYASCLSLSELFKATADSVQMKESINASITALNENFNENKAKYPKEELQELEFKLGIYIEILEYLSDNAHLFESNYIFAEFKLQSLIDYINDFVQIEFINTGKWVISGFVLLLFYFLRVFLPPLILF